MKRVGMLLALFRLVLDPQSRQMSLWQWQRRELPSTGSQELAGIEARDHWQT
jgi:hypothetical protein